MQFSGKLLYFLIIPLSGLCFACKVCSVCLRDIGIRHVSKDYGEKTRKLANHLGGRRCGVGNLRRTMKMYNLGSARDIETNLQTITRVVFSFSFTISTTAHRHHPRDARTCPSVTRINHPNHMHFEQLRGSSSKWQTAAVDSQQEHATPLFRSRSV